MKLSFIFPIILGCLIIPNQGSSPYPTDSTSSSDITNAATTESVSMEPSAAANTGSAETTITQAPGGSTDLNTGSTIEGPTGITGAATSKKPVDQTTPNSPVETTAAQNVPTTQADTWAEFDLDCNTTADYCIYSINAPQLSAAAYNAENSKYQTDKSEYLSASSKAYYNSASFYAGDVYQSYKDAKEKFDNLTMQMELLSDTVNQALEESQNQTELIKQSLALIKETYSSLSNCYYRTCALATVRPSPSTTTQRTKPPNACDTQDCKAPLDYGNGKCSLLFNGTATCQCPGNLDQKDGCKSVGCNLLKEGLKDGTVSGPFWSPGYERGTGGTYGSKLNCEYKISSNSTINVTVRDFKFDPSLTLTVNTRVVPKTVTTPDKLQKLLKTYVGSSKVLTVLFKTDNVPSTGGPYFLDMDLN